MVKPTRVVPALVLLVVDLLIWQIVLYLTFRLRFSNQELHVSNLEAYRKLVIWFGLSLVYFFSVNGLYNRRGERWETERVRILSALSVHTISIFALAYLLGGSAFPRSVLLAAYPVQLALLSLWRYVCWRISYSSSSNEPLVVIGSAEEIEKIAAKQVDRGSRLFGVLVGNAPHPKTVPLLGSLDQIDSFPERALLLIMPSVPISERVFIMERGAASGCEVALVPDLYEIALFSANFDHYDDVPLLFVASEFKHGLLVDWMKRLFDIVVALVGLVIATPIMAVIAIMIWIDDGAPILFTQERLGQHGRIFLIRKFRTMRKDAESQTGPVLATQNDPRVTRVGRYLRKTRLDELPQLINVLVGDMSLVGPRPERPVFVKQFEEILPIYRRRRHIKPGLTGLAQTVGKYDTPPEDKLRFDLLYASSRSLYRDMVILLRTVATVLQRNAH